MRKQRFRRWFSYSFEFLLDLSLDICPSILGIAALS
jgi:hypothetical protein